MPISTPEQAAKQLTRKKQLRDRWDLWGWYSVLFDLAEESIFKLENHDGISSAQLSNFHTAFMYLGKKSHYSSII